MTNLILPHNVSAYSSKIKIQSVANQVRNKSSIDKKIFKEEYEGVYKKNCYGLFGCGTGSGRRRGRGMIPHFRSFFCTAV